MLMRDQTLEHQILKLASGQLTGLGPRLVLRHCR